MSNYPKAFVVLKPFCYNAGKDKYFPRKGRGMGGGLLRMDIFQDL